MRLSAGHEFGPYVIVAPLGAGGMGEVYRARDRRLGRDVALKILSPAVAADHVRRQRFEFESRAVAALNHPNIVPVHDAGEGYFVCELVDGEPLLAIRPSVRKIIDIAVQIADGLAAAHEVGRCTETSSQGISSSPEMGVRRSSTSVWPSWKRRPERQVMKLPPCGLTREP